MVAAAEIAVEVYVNPESFAIVARGEGYKKRFPRQAADLSKNPEAGTHDTRLSDFARRAVHLDQSRLMAARSTSTPRR